MLLRCWREGLPGELKFGGFELDYSPISRKSKMV
jgi:hypothetical protein